MQDDSWLTRRDWKEGGYSGPPRWRRGTRPLYLLTSFALFPGLLTLFWLAFSGRLS